MLLALGLASQFLRGQIPPFPFSLRPSCKYTVDIPSPDYTQAWLLPTSIAIWQFSEAKGLCSQLKLCWHLSLPVEIVSQLAKCSW